MAAPERWWVVGAAAPHQPLRWKIVQSVSKPVGDFVDGPFTKAQAEADYKSKTSPITPPTLPSLPNPLSPLGKLAHWVGDIALHLSDTAMYRSLGWMALGVMLIATGIYLWFRTSQTYANLESAVVGTAKAL